MSHTTLLTLSRWQWALTAAFHITFPALTVGTDDLVWLQMFRFWRRIFGVGFALGVVSGIVMTFEFGLNWGRFSYDVGPILGVIIAMEVITAFFLEAGFLGLLIHGEGRISRRVMLFSTCMVSLGTLLSVSWILAANSWMQTPAGYKMVNGQFQPSDWWHVIFNPSFGLRVVHMLVATLVSAGWFIAGISAWYFTKRRHLEFARRGLSIGIGVLAILVPLQMFIGDKVGGDVVARYQLPKIIAAEGNWTSTNTGYNLFVIPDQSAAKNHLMVTVPRLGSIIGAKDWSGKSPTPGLDIVPPALRPSVWATFYGFRMMFFGALLMLAIAIVGVFLRLRGRLYGAYWFHKVLLGTIPLGVLAIWGGWVTAEAGRQPWLVYGKLLTADAVSPLKTWQVLASLIGFIGIYVVLLGTFIRYVARIVREGPDEGLASEVVTPPLNPRSVLTPTSA